MSLEERVIKAYYQKYFNKTIDNEIIVHTNAYKFLKFYGCLSFKKKIDYLYFYLSNTEIKTLWNSLGIEQMYNNLILESLNALIAYYKDKYPLTCDKNSEIITKLIMNEDILRLLRKDISKFKKIHCICNAALDSYIEIKDIYSFLKDIVIVDEDEYFRIDQNKCSIKLPLKQLFYPDSRTNFYLTFFNFFQDLPENKKYESFSQAVTTYRLKQFAKINKIKIVNINKDLKLNLNKYYESFHDFNDKEVQMYNVVFEKIDSFHYEDLDYLYEAFANLNIKHLNYYLKDNKVYFKTNIQNKFKALKNKNLNDFKLSLAIILEIMLNIQNDFSEAFSENKKTKYIDASLQRQRRIQDKLIK